MPLPLYGSWQQGAPGTQYRQLSGPDINVPISDPTAALRANASPTPTAAMAANVAINGSGPTFYGSAANSAGQSVSPTGQILGGSGGGYMPSNSDLFFASANAPSAPRTVSMLPNAANGQATYNTTLLNNLLAAYKQQSAQARADSLAQYNDLMGTVKKTGQNVDKYLGQLGQTGMARIAENEAQAGAKTEQDLISRGLGNTTIRNQQLRGVGRDAEQARQSLQEGLAGQRIGTTMGLTQMYGDALLSRQNVPPGNDYLQMIAQLGATGAGRPRPLSGQGAY